jgi:hypothetical protein
VLGGIRGGAARVGLGWAGQGRGENRREFGARTGLEGPGAEGELAKAF